MDEEIERYRDSELQSVELTADMPWEPYSSKFTERERAARASHSTSAVRVTSPCPPNHVTLKAKAEEEVETVHSPQRPLNLIAEVRCVTTVSQLAVSRASHDDWEETDLGSQLVAAVNATSTDLEGDGLFFGPEDSLFEKGTGLSAL
jgi:hypothetical protein